MLLILLLQLLLLLQNVVVVVGFEKMTKMKMKIMRGNLHG